jgi:hypothetical protein
VQKSSHTKLSCYISRFFEGPKELALLQKIQLVFNNLVQILIAIFYISLTLEEKFLIFRAQKSSPPKLRFLNFKIFLRVSSL